ncbi:MAG TPA: hypothetical protein VKB12_07005 [Pyrinomonadaceae bacterium]|nr:hypothetical protein [Pyrinomonadaceae bacterium]
MPSKLFVALISLTIISAAACRANEGVQTTNAQQAAPQPAAAVAVANTSPATPAPAAPNAPGGGNNPDADACKLLTSEEIQAVQGEGLKAAKGSDASTGSFSVSQCFYETASFTNSVSLTLTRKSGDAKGESPREFWKKNFGGERGRGREKEEREKEGREKKGGARVEEEEEGLPPTRVKGVGDEAYWVGNDRVGALYVLRGDKFIRISVGGADKQDKKIEKSKALAERALKRV